MKFRFLDSMLPSIMGVWFILFDISKSVALPAADLGDQTVSYYGGKDCLSFGNLDVSVDLNLTEGELDKVKEFQTEFHIPDDVQNVNCGNPISNITMISKDEFLEIDMIYKLENTTTSYATLVLLDVDVKIHDEPEFEEPTFLLSKRGYSAKNKTLSYQSRYNETFDCRNSKQRVIFHSPRAQAAIVFSQVRLQPYSKYVRLSNGKGVICPHGQHTPDSSTAHSEVFIPLILAVALTVVVLLIVIGYFVHKKIEGMGYTSME